MLIYNKNLMDITLPSDKGSVTFKGAWNRNSDQDLTASVMKYGCTEIDEQRWIELTQEFKDVHLIKSGQLFAAKNEKEAIIKISDLPESGNERLEKKDLEKNEIVKFGSEVK